MLVTPTSPVIVTDDDAFFLHEPSPPLRDYRGSDSLASGALVATQGWTLLNLGSMVPVALIGVALVWLAARQRTGEEAAR